jgi:hypothetical protein
MKHLVAKQRLGGGAKKVRTDVAEVGEINWLVV